jgi:hypothetical protein
VVDERGRLSDDDDHEGAFGAQIAAADLFSTMN